MHARILERGDHPTPLLPRIPLGGRTPRQLGHRTWVRRPALPILVKRELPNPLRPRPQLGEGTPKHLGHRARASPRSLLMGGGRVKETLSKLLQGWTLEQGIPPNRLI